MSTQTRPALLDDRYLLETGTVYLSGVQALARLPIEQNRRDRRAGLRIGTFICGYPGSPLGVYDLTVSKLGPLLEQHDIALVPGANEELAATAIMGTQMLDQFPHAKWDGVTAFWYGKGPGVDRSGDALKHGNFAGTSRQGAVVVLAGEDHEGKSSTMPFQDDYAFVSAGIPVLYPASVSEFLSLGLHAIALSRYSGCWIALKLVAPLCDGGETVALDELPGRVVLPTLELAGRPFSKRADFRFFPGTNIEHERHLYQERHQAVLAYSRANALNRITLRGPRDRLGIVSAGKSYTDTRQALLDLGLDDAALQQAGVRLLNLGLIYPLDDALVREFARDLDEIIVIEEKRGFLEAQVKESLCGLAHPLRVVGKHDETGAPLFPLHGGLDADAIAERLGPRLLSHLSDPAPARARLNRIESVRIRQYESHPRRTPNYCSGCPHNTSTVLLDGQLAWGSPGCHSFATLMEQPSRHIEAMTQYGGEGLPWVGLSRFTDRPHMVQNVGDGSLFHSSYLNIRFCVVAGANITFKILYNGYIANTGAQEITGARSIPALTRLLAEEGVARIAIVTKEPRRYAGERLGAPARVHDVRDYTTVMRELAATRGVTIMIYDETCANERRRRQKRGLEPWPNRFVVINEDVCENCGDCGAVSNCMSLQKVQTEFGPKTQVHASTCNQDYSCLNGDCPSFLTVDTRPGTGYARIAPPSVSASEIPEPDSIPALTDAFRIHIPGVGGTGVITLNALLGWAALMDGRRVLSYDQTGAAQKWGPVLSSIVIAPAADALVANRIGVAQADLYLALDPLAAATPVNLDRCTADHTALLLVTSALPTGEMVRNVSFTYSDNAVRDTIERQCRPDRTVLVDARRLAEGLFGDHMLTNLIALGAAYQAGIVPISAASIEAAIELNGVQVKNNLQAFRYGRLQICDPARIHALLPPERPSFEVSRAAALAPLSAADRRAHEQLLARCAQLDAESQQLVDIRIAELIDFQNADCARRYVDFVLRVAAAEQAALGNTGAITQAAARFHAKLLAYKDEYEVARLHLKPRLRKQTERLFEQPLRVSYHFHPPLLRALGLKRKLELGPWFNPLLRLLRAGKRLRGTVFDPFGYAALRREERALAAWYEGVMASALAALTPATHATVAHVAQLPDSIRGYEDIKHRSIVAARARARDLLGSMQEQKEGAIAR